MIYLWMSVSRFYGAGTCGYQLLRHMSKKSEVTWTGGPSQGDDFTDDAMKELILKHYKPILDGKVDGPLVQIAGPNMERLSKWRGTKEIGYIFFEKELSREWIRNLRDDFDIRIAGSEWNAELMREAGLDNVCAIPQGVDTDMFKPAKRTIMPESFLVFSGGKYEHRKAQDLVIRAVAEAQKTCPDMVLIASWYNMWDQDVVEEARHKAKLGGVTDISMLPPLPHDNLALIMANCDVGVFPNRAEGGTNLVMMECMASGIPVIARNETGQRDVLGADYAYLTKGTDNEVVEQTAIYLEKAYYDRTTLKAMGYRAREAMKFWSWERTADEFLKVINA
jgi:glycosyltransferase involved in cell wall biosynthesis